MVIILIVGAMLGWIASLMARGTGHPGGEHATGLNIAAGTGGTLITGATLSSEPLASVDPGIGPVLASLGGAVILLAFVNLVRRGSPH